MGENNKELGHMEDWESMIHFALNLILTSEIHKGSGIFGERIIITHLDHANELLMKAFLIKKGFIISYIERNDLKKGLKEDKILDKSKTLDYPECLKLVSNQVNFNRAKQDKILEFHKLRNEIQHRSTNIPLDKKEKIRNFYPQLKEFYELMFPEFDKSFPEIEF